MSVKVVKHPETGAVITASTKNAEYGTIRVDETHTSMEGGFVNIQNRTAFIRGRLEDLNKLGLKDGQSLPGKIIRKESFEPFYEGQAPKQYPKDHKQAGENVLTNGRETYLQYEYTSDINAGDTLPSESSVAVETLAETVASQAV